MALLRPAIRALFDAVLVHVQSALPGGRPSCIDLEERNMPRSVARFALRVCFLVCVIFTLALPAFAQKTWTGAAADGGNWNGSGNWKPTGVPDPTSDLIFDAT